MLKKIISISLFLVFLFSGTVYAEKKKAKNIYIKPFMVYVDDDAATDKKKSSKSSTSFKDSLMGQDFTDYMSEVIVEYRDYNLISDDEISNQIESVKGKMAAGGDDDESVKKIMKMIDSDCIIYGKIIKDQTGILTVSAVLLDRTSTSVRKTLIVNRDRYLDAAARALGHYLLSRDESYIKKFNRQMKKKDDEIADSEEKRLGTLSGVESSYEGQNECLCHSSFIRLGYGGFSGTSLFSNDRLNDYYPENQTFFGDIFIYRSKDAVGDGVDIYTRFFYKKFRADDSSYQKIAKDMAAFGTDDYRDIAGKYDPVPQDDLEMTQKGADLGFRFVGTAYFMSEAWSFYFMFGGRYMKVSEKYTSGGMEYEKEFSGVGGTGSIGLEVTLNRYMGIFAEINAGYVPVGDNKMNYDGAQLLFGVTFRTNHMDSPFLGFL